MTESIKNQRNLAIAIGMILLGVGLFVWWMGGVLAQNQQTVPQPSALAVSAGGGYQEIYIKALGTGLYDHPNITVKKGVPVRLHFSAEPAAGCGRSFVFRTYGIQLVSKNGEEQTATFTPTQTGVFEYSCSMRMFIGHLTVVD